MKCKDEERKDPEYAKAEEADIQQIRQGNYNYQGIRG